jgi:Protein of unknown function (DUF5663)
MQQEIQSILTTLGIQDLSEDERDGLMVQIADAIIPLVIVDAIQELSDTQQQEFEAAMDRESGNPLRMLEELEERVPEFRSIVAHHVALYMQTLDLVR